MNINKSSNNAYRRSSHIQIHQPDSRSGSTLVPNSAISPNLNTTSENQRVYNLLQLQNHPRDNLMNGQSLQHLLNEQNSNTQNFLYNS